jgi:hypothetical protein
MSGAEPIIAAEVIGSAAAAEGAAAAAAAATAAEAAAAASAAQTAATATGAANPFLSAAYGSLPGMTAGSQQAAMLAAQTGEFGLPGLMSTGGSATYSGAGGPLAKALFSSGTPTASRMGLQGVSMLQQSQPRPMGQAPGIKRGQALQAPDIASYLPQPIQRKRLSLL